MQGWPKLEPNTKKSVKEDPKIILALDKLNTYTNLEDQWEIGNQQELGNHRELGKIFELRNQRELDDNYELKNYFKLDN